MERPDDAALVAALLDGNPEAFARMYDAYADRLFSYAVALVRDRDTAADVVHDAFLLAHDRVGQLRDPSRLRPWLYAVVRSEGLRALRRQGRVTDLDAAGDVMDTTTDLDAGLAAEEARALVGAALAGLSDGDREVVELAIRHDLDNGEVAAALGVDSSQGSAMVSRAKSQLEKALTSVVLLRTRGRSCDALRAVIGDATSLTPLLRKRIARHAADCENCEQQRRAAVVGMPGVAMAAPLLTAPVSLRERLVSSSGEVAAPAAASALGARTAAFGPDGFPRFPAPRRRRRAAVAGLVGALLLVLLVGGVAALAGGSDPAPATPVAAATSPTAVATPSASLPSPSGSVRSNAPAVTAPRSTTPLAESTLTDGTRTGAPADRGQSPRPRTPRPRTTRPGLTTAPVPPPTAAAAFTWTDLDEGSCPSSFTGRVVVTVSGAQAASVTALWVGVVGGTGSGSAPLTRTGANTWQGDVTAPAQQENRVQVRVTTDRGVVTTTADRDFSHICPG